MKPTRPSRIPHVAATVMVGCLLLAAVDPRNLLAHTTGGHTGAGADPTVLPAGATTVVLNLVLTNFKDALPIPAVLQRSRQTQNYRVPVDTNLVYPGPLDVYDIPMLETNHWFHADLPPVKVWGYAGQYPGPTIEAKVGVPIVVHWINSLTNNDGQYPYWLLADPLLFHGGHESGLPEQAIRTVVHLHGAAVLPRYDGYPTNWFVAGESDEYFYANIDLNSDGQTLWYHDHAIGVTANNVYAGLAGFYLVRNAEYDAARGILLPSGAYEIPLVFQDRDFAVTTWTNNNGVIQVETNLCSDPNLVAPWHTYPVVNGKIAPYLAVEPRPYRFRILNGAGFRSLALQMLMTDAAGNVLTNADVPTAPVFTVVGNEDGYLQYATNVSRIATMPGERVDVVVDFSSYTNAAYPYVTVVNAFGGNLGGDSADVVGPPYITNLMQFRVNLALSPTVPTNMSIPSPLVTNWISTETLLAHAVRHRSIELDLSIAAGVNVPFQGGQFNPTNGGYPFALINLTHFREPITELPHAGDVEVWDIVNLSDEAHPLHVHLLDFRVVDRQRLASDTNSRTTPWNENPKTPPVMVTNYINDRIAKKLLPLTNYLSLAPKDLKTARPFETGPKDVVRAAPFAVTRIVMQWPTNEIFYTTPSAKSGDRSTDGRFIYHCHILDHEDNDMMRPLQVKPPWQPDVDLLSSPDINPGGFNHFAIAYDHRPNQTYAVEWAADIRSPNWSPVGTSPTLDLPNSRWLVVPESSTDPRRFYRVRGLLPEL